MKEWESKGPGFPQNRYYPRIETEVLIAYRTLIETGDEEKVVKTKSFGLGGLMFETESALPLGRTFLLDILLGDARLEVQAMVVYSNQIAEGCFQNGFSFTGLSAKENELLTSFFLQEYERGQPPFGT